MDDIKHSKVDAIACCGNDTFVDGVPNVLVGNAGADIIAKQDIDEVADVRFDWFHVDALRIIP